VEGNEGSGSMVRRTDMLKKGDRNENQLKFYNEIVDSSR
jgi:hypothetical protein